MHHTLVLNVDGQPKTRAARRRGLEGAGFEVEDADDSRTALDAARRLGHRPLLVLVRPPQPDGGMAEFSAALRRDTAMPVYLVVLTAGSKSASAPLPAGADLQLRDGSVKPEWVATLAALGQLLEQQARDRQRIADLEAQLAAARAAPESARPAAGQWWVDFEAGLEYRDAAVNRILGLAPEATAAEASPSGHRIQPEDRPRVEAAFQRLTGKGESYDEEFRLLLPDGSFRWVRDQGRVLRDGEGQPRFAVGILADISERKSSESTIRELNQRLQARVDEFESLLEFAPIGIMLVEDPEGRRLRLNPALERLYGIKSGPNPWLDSDPVGAPQLKFMQNGHELTLEEAPLPVAMATGRPVENFELDLVFPDGRVVNQLGHAIPLFNESGGVRGAILASMDITQRKQAEQELRQQKEILQTILDTVPVMICFIDAAGNLRFVNRCFTETLGWTLAECQGRDVLSDLYPDPHDRAKVLDYIRHPPPGFADFETRVRDGRILQTSWTNVILSDGTSVGLGLDVTDRRRTEREKNRLIEIIEATPDIVTTADGASRLTYLNRAARELFGIGPGEAADSPRISDLHPDWAYRLLVDEGIPAAIKNGAWTGDTALRGRDGGEIQVSQLVIIHRDGQGRLEAISTVSRDIDERKREEQALKFDRALFHGLQTVAPVGLAYVDWNTRFIRINDALAEINGLPARAHIGRTVQEIVPDLWTRLESIYRRVLEQGEVVANLEISGTTRAEPAIRRHWVTSVYPLRMGGDIVAAGIVVQDISERIQTEEALRRSERRLDMALMGAELGTFDWDIKTGHMWLDDRWARLFGPRPEDLITDYADWAGAVHPDDRERVLAALNSHLRGERPYYEAEYRIRAPGERWVWVLCRGRVLERDSRGEARRLAGVYRDVSARKDLEARLEQQQQHLLHMQRLTTAGELVAIVGHELSQPLAAISNFLGGATLRFYEALKAHPALAEAIQEALSQSQRAAAVVSSLRELVRGQDSRKEWVAVPTLIQDSLLLAEAELRRRRIHLAVDVAADLPEVWGQRVFLQQLLLNLFLNAMEAMQAIPADTRALRIRAEANADGDILLEVADSGPGIVPGIANTLFEPFVTTKPAGIGLGLSICRTIVEAHDGWIAAESTPERGAVFSIRLPTSKP